MSTYTTDEAAGFLLHIEGFGIDDIEGIMGILPDVLPDADPDALTYKDLDAIAEVLDHVEDDVETTITFRPHFGPARTVTLDWQGFVALARQWWATVADKDFVADELGAPGYDFESIYYRDVADTDEAEVWWDEQEAKVADWLGTYRGVAAWAGWDRQPAVIRLER